MKKTAKLSLLTIFLAVVTLTTILGLKFVPTRDSTNNIAVGWGDNGGGRLSYTLNEINSGILGDSIIFNTISDSVIGNEKNFVAARENTGINAGRDNVWSPNDITVENGKEYIVRLYVHNNSPEGMNAVSKNTRVAFSVPNESSTSLAIYGYIFSDNAFPSEYWDGVIFNSDSAFHLEYIAGSALLENNGVGNDGGIQLSDNIVYKAASEHGVQIGYSSLNGEVPGCYSYDSVVTVKVKVVYDTAYTMTQQVRLVGSSEWSDTVDANVGDKVEFWIQYRNTSSETQDNVMIRDVLPTSLRYVAGTTKLWNDHLDGAVNNENTIATTGINIGHYGPNANAHIRFQAEVVEDGLICGSNVLGNWAQVSAADVLMQNATVVKVNKDE